MNKLRRTCAISILTMALTVSALAGTIDSPGAKPPTEPSSTNSITTTVILTILSLIR